MKCSVHSCKNYNGSGHTFHGFPKDKQLQKKWVEFCDKLKVNVNRGKICSAHFKPDDFTNYMKVKLGHAKILILTPNACPSLLNGSDSDDCYNGTDRAQIIKNILSNEEEPTFGEICQTSSGQTFSHCQEGFSETAVYDWRSWCRLCAKDDVQENRSVFFEDAQRQDDHNMAATIENYFGVKIIPSGDLPEMLCVGCISLLTALMNFSQRVVKVQQLYVSLQEETETGVNVDLTALRLKCGLLDGDDETIAEMHNNDTESNIIELQTEFVDEAEFTCIENDQFNSESVVQEASVEEYYLDEEELEPENNPLPFSDDEYECSNNDLEQEVLDDLDWDMNQEEETVDDDDGTAEKGEMKLETEGSHEGCVNEDATCSMASNHAVGYTCEECSRKFQRFFDYRAHMKRAHSQNIPLLQIPCPDCPHVFYAQYQLNEHAKKHVPVELKKVIPCPHCDQKFSSVTAARLHIRFIHNNERSFICEQCGVTVRTLVSLNSHMLTHANDAPFICRICKKGFKKPKYLKTHMEIHDPKKYECTKCGKQLNSRTTFKMHSYVHSDERKYKCDYCERTFKTTKSLKVHLILHTDLMPYFCEFCERNFNCPSYLGKHKWNCHPEEMAAQQASGHKNYTLNIPKIAALRAVAKTAENLRPVGLKRIGRKPAKETIRKRYRKKMRRPKVSAGPAEGTKNDVLPAPDQNSESTGPPTTCASNDNNLTPL